MKINDLMFKKPETLKSIFLESIDNRKPIIYESFSTAFKKFAQEENPDVVERYIDVFKTLVSRNIIKGKERDISFWIKKGWKNFVNYIEKNKNKKSKSEIKKDYKSKGSITVYKDDNLKIIIPYTIEASQLYGSNTKWCTTEPRECFNPLYGFLSQNRIPFYIILENGNKYAFLLGDESEAFVNEKDKPIKKEEFLEETGLNDLSIFTQWISKNKETLKKIHQHAKAEFKKDVENQFPQELYIYTELSGERWIEKEKEIVEKGQGEDYYKALIKHELNKEAKEFKKKYMDKQNEDK